MATIELSPSRPVFVIFCGLVAASGLALVLFPGYRHVLSAYVKDSYYRQMAGNAFTTSRLSLRVQGNIVSMEFGEVRRTPVGERRPGRWYDISNGSEVTDVQEFDVISSSNPAWILLNSLQGPTQQRIANYRDKHQALFESSLGSIVSETAYWYDSPMSKERQQSHFKVTCQLSPARDSEPPIEIKPSSESRGKLEAVSIARFVEYPTGEKDCAALLYHPNGEIAADSSEIPGILEQVWSVGIPKRFDVQGYLKTGKVAWPRSEGRAITSVVSIHYDRNRLVEQTIFHPDGRREVQMLRYRLTPVDLALDELDQRIGLKLFATGGRLNPPDHTLSKFGGM